MVAQTRPPSTGDPERLLRVRERERERRTESYRQRCRSAFVPRVLRLVQSIRVLAIVWGCPTRGASPSCPLVAPWGRRDAGGRNSFSVISADARGFRPTPTDLSSDGPHEGQPSLPAPTARNPPPQHHTSCGASRSSYYQRDVWALKSIPTRWMAAVDWPPL